MADRSARDTRRLTARRQRDAEARQRAREDEERRALEQERNTQARQRAREDAEQRAVEQERDTEARQRAREDEERRALEQERDTEARQRAREDEERRAQERERDAEARQRAREDEERRAQERERDAEARQSARQSSLDRVPWDSLVEGFTNECQQGPVHLCSCCGGLWFHRSIRSVSSSQLPFASDAFLQAVFGTNSAGGDLCSTCYGSVRAHRVPRLALSNGLALPIIPPEVVELTRLEARLVSPAHIFQNIWAVFGPHGQLRTKGRIVNVPVSVPTIVESLPRLPSDASVIHLRLARQIHVERNYTSGNIRPNVVFRAATVLTGSPLFRDHGIQLSQRWLAAVAELPVEAPIPLSPEAAFDSDSDEEETSTETMLSSDEGLRMAPAEGNRPSSILADDDSIFLAFPELFGGERLTPSSEGKSLSRSEIFKSLARSEDRRFSTAVYFLLFMAKALEIGKISSNRSIHMRKRKRNGDMVAPTAQDMLCQHFVDGLILDDNAYRVLQGVRNSGVHWKGEGYKVRAMIRTFGIATLFVTISAAELKWTELLVILKQALDKTTITNEEASGLSNQEKAALIQGDPVTCARYFENRFRALKATFAYPAGPFGGRKVTHFYQRVEFQHRGSPHVHMMIWLDGAPQYSIDPAVNNDEVISFIDELITCTTDYPPEDPICELLNRQVHKHTHTCYKRSRSSKICRFNIPFYPMDRTRILEPLELETESRSLKRQHLNIRDFLEQLSPNTDLSFLEFLVNLSMSVDDYLLAIRSSLRKPKVFLRRRPCDMYVNNYNEKILRLQQSNMDCQFILDPYACCAYVVDYINKSDRGMSQLLKRVLQEVRSGHGQLRDSLQALGAAHNLHSELSAQEAAYNVLQMPMSMSSETCIFIQTSPSSERSRMLKPPTELEQMGPQDVAIFVPGLLEHYAQRPLALDQLNLAQFSAWYEYSKTCRRQPVVTDSDVDDVREDTQDSVLKLQDGSGFLRKRKFPKVVRYVRYNINTHRDNYFRELVMLYRPWRDEELECGEDVDCETLVARYDTQIRSNQREFNYLEDAVLEAAIREAETAGRGDDETVDGDANRPLVDESAGGSDQNADFGTYERRPFSEAFQLPLLATADEYFSMLLSLNDDQRDLLQHVLADTKRDEEPYNIYLKGGAGVGKSHLVKTLYQGLLRVFNRSITINPDKVSVLLVAPTGRAAFEIGGITVHTAFQLPINQREAGDLSADVANTMAGTYSDLQTIIIDEISMVADHVLEQVDKRLRDLFDQSSPFGGKNVLTVGDFYQLPPVKAVSLVEGAMSNCIRSLFGQPLWHRFLVHSLEVVMRQREDATFAAALNNMAKGEMTADDIILFRSRCVTSTPPEIEDQRPLHLFFENEHTNAFNDAKLARMPGEVFVNAAIDSAFGAPSPAARLRYLNGLKNKPYHQTMGLPPSLALKVGARYMMTSNLDCLDGLVNGVMGVLRQIDIATTTASASSQVVRVWIEFEDRRCGARLREKYRRLADNLGISQDCTPIELITLEIRRNTPDVKLTRKQFPLIVAEAITIHKSQGGTYKFVILHIRRGIARALLYVACSRATTSGGLFIVGNFNPPKPPAANSGLALEMKRHDTVRLVPKFLHLRKRIDGLVQLISHNAQSLHKHYAIYAGDSCYTASDILLFSETWTLASDVFSIGNHVCVASANCPSERAPVGARIYVLPAVSSRIIKTWSTINFDHNGSCSTAGINVNGTNIISIYRSPRCPWKLLLATVSRTLAELGGAHCILAGDFNYNFAMYPNSIERSSLESAGLQLQSPIVATTKFGTTIDAIFCDFGLNECGLYNTCTSVHEPLWARFSLP